MFKSLSELINEWLIKLHFSEKTAFTIADISDFLIVLFVSFFLYYLIKKIATPVLKRMVKRTATQWDDAILKSKLINRASLLIPFLIFYHSIPVTLNEFSQYLPLLQVLLGISFIIIFILIFNAVLNSAYYIYQETKYALYHPIKGFIQVGKIIVFTIGVLLIVSILFDQPVKYMLTGLGAFSAVLLLVFKDPILGFVSGIQISANDMVRQGDWITMPKYGADGNIMEISLTTVKIQNFDNTITTLPTYSLVAESFQNHRNVRDTGLKRLKRSINIDMSSVIFCGKADLEKYKQISMIEAYINQTENELAQINANAGKQNTPPENFIRQTNIGIFRAYLETFLSNYPGVEAKESLVIRQLQPTETGIPIEIYTFTSKINFADYEKLQADIFDHILAIIPFFGLKVFQSPTGGDFKNVGKTLTA